MVGIYFDVFAKEQVFCIVLFFIFSFFGGGSFWALFPSGGTNDPRGTSPSQSHLRVSLMPHYFSQIGSLFSIFSLGPHYLPSGRFSAHLVPCLFSLFSLIFSSHCCQMCVPKIQFKCYHFIVRKL